MVRNTSDGFGAPVALPGQKGYKQTTSERLEAEAASMEAKLNSLRMTLNNEKAKRDSVVYYKGGSRWKSARKEAGSIRNYQKDVLSRTKKKKPIPTTDTSAWSVSQVSTWLKSLNLQEYTSTFVENEIDGNILLEMTLDDLDYLKITKLSHRKIILSSLKKLKGKSNSTHWSCVKPLCENVVSSPANNKVNLADGEFNEKESHDGFLKALMEWRDSKPPSDSTMWTNPMDNNGGLLLQGTYDEEAAQKEFQQAVAEWRSDSKKSSCWECYKVYHKTTAYTLCDKGFCSNECLKKFKSSNESRFYNS